MCVCVFSIKNIWQGFMSAFVCVPRIHLVGVTLMGRARYRTWDSLQACDFLLRGELFGLISLAFKGFNI